MKSLPEITAIVLCAGSSTRAQLGYNKVLHGLSDTTVAARTAEKFARFDRLIVVCTAADEPAMRGLIRHPNAEFVTGGSTRTESVRNALKHVGSTDIVIIHDGARPFVTGEVIDDSVQSAIKTGSGIAAIRSVNALKILKDGKLVPLNRDSAFVIQTPQSFRFSEIRDAYSKIAGNYADDSEVYSLAGYDCTLSKGDPSNVKLTSYRDFAGLNDAYRIGFGFDVHRLEEGRKLVLCGVTVPYEKGLLGHSDADVPVHAVMDAILSAAGLPDIGVLFPDTDPALEGADSIGLLREVVRRASGFEIINVSVCIIAEKPKLASFVPAMRETLANALGIDKVNVNVSATTTEKLGVTGEGKGIAAAADVLLKIR